MSDKLFLTSSENATFLSYYCSISKVSHNEERQTEQGLNHIFKQEVFPWYICKWQTPKNIVNHKSQCYCTKQCSGKNCYDTAKP